jgi:transcriptional regulator with XRE-family HTH domain
MQEVRRMRQERGWNQTELAFRSRLAPSVISQIENGKRDPSAGTLKKLAKALEVDVADLFPKAQASLPFDDGPSLEDDDGPSLEELHATAQCGTDWLTKPEEEWRASWPLSLTPQEAMQIVQEIAYEFAALKPLMDAQEAGLPIYKSAISGRYRQAWLRFFDGMRAAHKCGVANGLIAHQETLNDLEKKLGETPGVRYEKMLLAG